ncbi:MAG TPA: hypothetical protein VF554_13285, partial [Thermoanaerobaculia bacterium]
MTRKRAIGAVAVVMAFGFGFSSNGEEGRRTGAAGTSPAAQAKLRAFEEESSSSLRTFEEIFRREMREMGAVGAGLVVVRGSKILLSS